MEIVLALVVLAVLIGLVVYRVNLTRKERQRVADVREQERRADQAHRDRQIEAARQARKQAVRESQSQVRSTRITDASGRPVSRPSYNPPKRSSSSRLSDDDILTNPTYQAAYYAASYTYDETPSRGSYSSGSDSYSGGSSYSSSSDSSSSSYSSSSDSGSSYSGGSDF